jgi:hypothetical protein
MKNYVERKNKVILSYIIEFVKKNNTDMDIDNTITVTANDLTEVLNECQIKDFSFEYVKGLKKTLAFESYKILYKDDKILKIIIDKDDLLTFDKVPLKYM